MDAQLHAYVLGEENSGVEPVARRRLQAAVYLNDKYSSTAATPTATRELLGPSPASSTAPWFERPIFGTIRYMSGNAARKKFDADKYIEQMAELAQTN